VIPAGFEPTTDSLEGYEKHGYKSFIIKQL